LPELALTGCRTEPLLSYLKTLGLFRHVAGCHAQARLTWHPEGYALLRSELDEEGLVTFFLDEYQPSPITSPWNGGSGYFAGDNIEAITAVEVSSSPRLEQLRETIALARDVVASVDRIADKSALLERWRAVCPDPALEWCDAAVVLTEQGPSMNPLLGTGGNDGRLEFSNNFLARLLDCLPQLFRRDDDEGGAATRLRAALFEQPAQLARAAVGMFQPGTAGLPNSSSSAAGEAALVNPWDFVLGMEGALVFASGTARALSHQRALFPFTVRGTSRVGIGLDAGADANVRGEVWLPIWRKPASLMALKRLFSEGRLQDGRGQARGGREAFRAVADLGVDRGVAGFERVVYAERFGRNYVAVPAGRLDVKPVRSVELLRAADMWVASVRRKASSSGPLRSALALIDRSAADLASAADERAALERWLLALAQAQLALARDPTSRDPDAKTHVRPLSRLPGRIVTTLPHSSEHRLARTLAAVGRNVEGMPFRSLIESVTPAHRGGFAWSGERPPRGLARVRSEELLVEFAIRAGDSLAETESAYRARLPDIAAFLRGGIEVEYLTRLAYALSLCEPVVQRERGVDPRVAGLDRLYAAARLVTCDPVARRPGGLERPLSPARTVVRALAAGQATAAARTAVSRLRSDDLAPYRALERIDRSPSEARRIAAALAFPLHPDDRDSLEQLVLEPEQTVEPASTPKGAPA